MHEVIDKTFKWLCLAIIVLTLLGIAGRIERIEKHTLEIEAMLLEASK